MNNLVATVFAAAICVTLWATPVSAVSASPQGTPISNRQTLDTASDPNAPAAGSTTAPTDPTGPVASTGVTLPDSDAPLPGQGDDGSGAGGGGGSHCGL